MSYGQFCKQVSWKKLLVNDLRNYIDRHKDRMCFVLGSGPSLRKLDPEMLGNHITIAVNSSLVKVPKAQYYFTCDQSMTLWKSWSMLKNCKCNLILASNNGLAAYDARTGAYTFEDIDKEQIQYIGRKDNNRMDKGNKLIKGSSSVHPAVHFAYVLGCSPIVLLGCDCQYAEGKKWFYQFPGQPVDELLKPEYDKYRKPLAHYTVGNATDGELKHHIRVWKEIASQNIGNIIDVSGGALTMFPQKSLEEILRDE